MCSLAMVAGPVGSVFQSPIKLEQKDFFLHKFWCSTKLIRRSQQELWPRALQDDLKAGNTQVESAPHCRCNVVVWPNWDMNNLFQFSIVIATKHDEDSVRIRISFP